MAAATGRAADPVDLRWPDGHGTGIDTCGPGVRSGGYLLAPGSQVAEATHRHRGLLAPQRLDRRDTDARTGLATEQGWLWGETGEYRSGCD